MRVKFIFLVLLLMAGPALAAPPASGGQIVPLDGSIQDVNLEKNTINIGMQDYRLVATSVIIVNGVRGHINDLSVGMKVTGSVETPHFGNSRPSVMGNFTAGDASSLSTIRMINATTNPGYVAPSAANPAATPFPDSSQAPVPPAAPVSKEMQDDLTKKLSGTFWTVGRMVLMSDATAGGSDTPVNPGLNRPPGTRPRTTGPYGSTPGPYRTPGQYGSSGPYGANGPYGMPRMRTELQSKWFYLNADGSTICEWSTKPGKWSVSGENTIQVNFNSEGFDSLYLYVKFDPQLAGGSVVSGGRFIPANTPVNAVSSPTQAMLDQVPAPPPSPEIQKKAADIVAANSRGLVFVTGQEGVGSGFIASMDGANFLVTNAHVAAGINGADFKTLDGSVLKSTVAGVAVGHDIFRMALPNTAAKPFEVMQGVAENTSIGDDVVVLGNAEGSGVINTIIGKIVGIGPNLVEINAQFVPGNSGSPIIHIKTGKVIGVATYTLTRKYDSTTREKMRTPVIRRFGYRLDSVKTWQPVNWQVFYAEATAMTRIHTLTEDLDGFFEDIYKTRGKITVAQHTNPVIKARIAQWVDSKGKNMSAVDRHNADANFLSFLKVACQSDLATVRGRLAYDYFQRRLLDETETRTGMAKAFEKIINEIKE